MKRTMLYSTILAGVMGVGTLVLFNQGTQAMSLSDFSRADQKIVTQDGPKAGGAVLVREDIVYPPSGGVANVTPAQGTARAGDVGTPGVGIDGHVDVTTMPNNAYNRTEAQIADPGALSHPATHARGDMLPASETVRAREWPGGDTSATYTFNN
ncbi:MAG: hypothetical protein H6865_07730 [Rhodospirillales bacterium]|nr:hypothetical protein [Alphaproteobacteria bacterium]MCB9987505.1 hypothetical protein [Rhodospirillales bacterium]USO07521.1 MAG: hypothetical protein H6866_08925 [Rhodospirillales bacterium]